MHFLSGMKRSKSIRYSGCSKITSHQMMYHVHLVVNMFENLEPPAVVCTLNFLL